MQTYLNYYCINTAKRRLIAMVCVLRALIYWRGAQGAPRYTAPENGDLAVLPDIFSQGVLREHVSRRNDPPDLLPSMLLFVKLRQPIFAAWPQSGHDYIPGNQKGKAENVHRVYPSAILGKYENFINRLKGKETNLKGANHELQG